MGLASHLASESVGLDFDLLVYSIKFPLISRQILRSFEWVDSCLLVNCGNFGFWRSSLLFRLGKLEKTALLNLQQRAVVEGCVLELKLSHLWRLWSLLDGLLGLVDSSTSS